MPYPAGALVIVRWSTTEHTFAFDSLYVSLDKKKEKIHSTVTKIFMNITGIDFPFFVVHWQDSFKQLQRDRLLVHLVKGKQMKGLERI